jgi:hypothetical protein
VQQQQQGCTYNGMLAHMLATAAAVWVQLLQEQLYMSEQRSAEACCGGHL